MSDFECPDFSDLDKGLIEDFRATVNDSQEEIDACIQRLNQTGREDDVHRLFRAMHSFKGNCRMVSLDPLVELLHDLEDIAGDLRQERFAYTPSLGNFMLEVVDIGRELVSQLVEQGHADDDIRRYLITAIRRIREAPDQDRDDFCRDVLAELHGEPPQQKRGALPELPGDITLMKELASQLDSLSIYRKGRSEQVLDLCRNLNEALGQPIDPAQLAAAVYFHDLGMAFVPAGIVQKHGVLEREEVYQVQMHVHVGARLLQRFGDWDEAAAMVMQHHERFDGSGYPNRLKGEQIHTGARLIAIADSFCAMTNERHDRTYKKTLFTAVREVNAESGAQFDSEVVEVFNDVIRQHYLTR